MPTAYSIMLAIHCKKTESVDLKTPLLSYIRSTYSEQDAQEASDDLTSIQHLRSEIALASTNASQPGMKDSLAKYVRCLTAIENRFPISKEKGHAQVAFSWFDAFRPAKKVSQNNIHFEKAAVLFNLAAVVSQQGLACDRGTPEGLVAASKLFMEAAGLFAHIKEAEANKTDAPRPADLTPECIGLLEKLMLAQAQECVYHKAVLDKKSPGLVARLARQTASMYDECERAFAAPSLAGYFDKSWAAHVQLKASLYDVETLIQASRALHAEDAVAQEVAVLREAFARLQATKKLAKAVSSDMVDSTARVQENVTTLLARAEKDNNNIYLQKVPAFGETPGAAVQPACLVKPALPGALLDASSEQLFTGLIPDSSAKSLSRYTDMVDGVMREACDRLAAATDNARIKLKELELPEMLDALDAKGPTPAVLPEAVRREVEDVVNIGGVGHLKSILAEIGELRRGVEDELVACQRALDEDARVDGECRGRHGDAWRAQPAASASKPYWDRIQQFRSSLQKAGDSDAGIIARLTDHEGTLAELNIDAAVLKMPRLQAPMVSVGPEDPAVVVASLRRQLDALQGLAAERAGMEEALREMKAKDNILPKLMATGPQAHDALFTAELKKYEPLKEDIGRNVVAQDQLLAEVDAGARAFRTLFDVSGWRTACESAAGGIRESVKMYRELLDHLSEGLRFYIGMQEVARKCRQECDDFAYTRGVQRDELERDLARRAKQEEDEKLSRQMAMASLHAPPPGAPPAAYPAPPPGSTVLQQQRPAAPPPPPPAAAPAPPPPPPAAAAPPPPLPPAAPAPPAYHQHPAAAAPPPPQQQHYYGYAPQQQHYQAAAPPPPPPHYAQQQPQYVAGPPGQYAYAQPPVHYAQQAPPPPPYGYAAAPPPPYGAPPPPYGAPPYGYGYHQ